MVPDTSHRRRTLRAVGKNQLHYGANKLEVLRDYIEDEPRPCS
jgi:hypothetical protein